MSSEQPPFAQPTNGTASFGSPPAPGNGFAPPTGRYAPDPAGFARHGFADQLSIETPEQVALEFPVAGIGSRFVALLLDHLIQFAATIALFLIFLLIDTATGSREFKTLATKWFVAAVSFAYFLLLWGYFSLFEAFWRGQTPGKRVMKLRVIKDSGRQITLFESLARNLLRAADYLPSLYLAGVITMLCNKRNKRLGDLAAGTVVVHERGDAEPLLYTGPDLRSTRLFSAPAPGFAEPWRAAPADAGAEGLFAADAVSRLGRGDLTMIETFFARALDLPLETRAAMAHRMLGELVKKMGVALPGGNPERALEAIAVSLRGGGRRL